MPTRLFTVRAWIAMGALAGIALSLPLWLTRDTYPRAPLFDFIPSFPPQLDSLFLIAFAATLLILVWRPRIKPLAIFWILAAAFLALQDQSRLQPWFVEYVLLFAAIVFLKSKKEALDSCRLVLAAIYFWSGVHKMNASFASGLFPWLVSPFARFGIAGHLQHLGILVPFLEMGMGVALFFQRTRRAGVVSILGTHVFLLAVLGPWALKYNSVVWPWSLAMIVLVPYLFWNTGFSLKEFLMTGRAPGRWAFLLFVTVLPILSLAGLWDTYPSFALYSGNPMSGSIVLTPAAWERLDAQTRNVAEKFGGTGYRIHFDEWSEATMNVPSYPAKRVLRRIAQSFCKVHAKDMDIAFVVEQPSESFYRAGWYEVEETRQLCRLVTREETQ